MTLIYIILGLIVSFAVTAYKTREGRTWYPLVDLGILLVSFPAGLLIWIAYIVCGEDTWSDLWVDLKTFWEQLGDLLVETFRSDYDR